MVNEEFDKDFKKYVSWQGDEKGYAPKTVASSVAVVKQFIKVRGGAQEEKEISPIEPDKRARGNRGEEPAGPAAVPPLSAHSV